MRAYYATPEQKAKRAAYRKANPRTPRPTTAAQKAKRAAWQRENRILGRAWDQTPEGKAKKRAIERARQQTPEYKAKAAARYQRKREAQAAHPRPELCEICGNPPNGMGALHWDHCHTTGVFRGWLCHSCNHALGHVRDDPALLRRMADYLDRFPRPEGEYQPKARRRRQPAVSCAMPGQDSLF